MSIGSVAAKLGVPVFPCAEDKRPITANGFKAATTDPASIIAAFDRPGAALIGVPTGEISNTVVIDVDIRSDRTGMDWLNENADALPQTRTHKTKSGGLHLVFVYPLGHDIRNSAGRIAPGIDVRGNGGYIIVPPSPGYAVADPSEPAEMPMWLVRACLPPPAPERPVSAAHVREIESRRLDGFVRSVLSNVSAAGPGQKHSALLNAALALGGIQVASGLSDAAATDMLLRALPEGVEDWKNAGETAQWGLEKGRQRPLEFDDRYQTYQSHTPEPPPEDDPGYWTSLESDASMSAEEWSDLDMRESGTSIPASPAAVAKAGPDVLWTLTGPWDEASIPPRPWIARGYLMRGSVTVVSGPGSAGKSSLMVAWAACLTIGCAFNRMRADAPLRVATYNVEDDESEQKRRFSAMLRTLKVGHDAIGGRLAIIGPSRVGTLLQTARDGSLLVNTPVMDRLDAFVQQFRPDVLILDPFVELHGAEENDNTAVRAVMARFRAMAVEYGMAVVILHHARKGIGTPGDPDSLRGASSIVGAARVALTLNVMTEEEAAAFAIQADDRRDYFRLDGAKNNYAPIEEAEWFERLEQTLLNGDGVAVAWPWKPKSVLAQHSSQDLNAALDRIHDGVGYGVLFTPTRRGQSTDRWAGNVFVEMLGMTEEQAALLVSVWLKNGVLVRTTYRDPVQRKDREGVTVDHSKRPT